MKIDPDAQYVDDHGIAFADFGEYMLQRPDENDECNKYLTAARLPEGRQIRDGYKRVREHAYERYLQTNKNVTPYTLLKVQALAAAQALGKEYLKGATQNRANFTAGQLENVLARTCPPRNPL